MSAAPLSARRQRIGSMLAARPTAAASVPGRSVPASARRSLNSAMDGASAGGEDIMETDGTLAGKLSNINHKDKKIKSHGARGSKLCSALSVVCNKLHPHGGHA